MTQARIIHPGGPVVGRSSWWFLRLIPGDWQGILPIGPRDQRRVRERERLCHKMRFPHLKLTDWPFQTVPDPRFCTFMADREQVQADVENLLRNMARREQSSIHLVWAWFGSGKTHTLKYLCYLCEQRLPASETVYTEFPKSTKSFLDLYKAFIQELDAESLKEDLTDLFTAPGLEGFISTLRSSFPDLGRAVRSIVFGDEQQRMLATRWLRADDIPVRELRSLGIVHRLDTPDAAVRTISWLCQLLGSLGPSKSSIGRLVWVIDEFQLIEKCRPAVIQEITGSLHSVFNRAATHLSLFISFSGKPGKQFPGWLSKELADRIGIEKVVVLPPLRTDEGVQFVQDLMTHFRAPGETAASTFPFENGAVSEVLRTIQQKKVELKPRILMQCFHAVLEAAEDLIESGRLKSIRADFVREVLQDRMFQEDVSSD
jgi:hypothetical protein